MSNLKFNWVWRMPLPGSHWPLATKLASGTVMLKRSSRHSRSERALARFSAKTSTRPSVKPRNSVLSTTMSKSGMLTGCSLSKVSTSVCVLLASFKWVKRA